uniref:Uncharacterized protein n=1 Tax=Glossina pallidipes TaxID=7398 RepID=A0A1B0A4W3_GLOPL
MLSQVLVGLLYLLHLYEAILKEYFRNIILVFHFLYVAEDNNSCLPCHVIMKAVLFLHQVRTELVNNDEREMKMTWSLHQSRHEKKKHFSSGLQASKTGPSVDVGLVDDEIWAKSGMAMETLFIIHDVTVDDERSFFLLMLIIVTS